MAKRKSVEDILDIIQKGRRAGMDKIVVWRNFANVWETEYFAAMNYTGDEYEGRMKELRMKWDGFCSNIALSINIAMPYINLTQKNSSVATFLSNMLK